MTKYILIASLLILNGCGGSIDTHIPEDVYELRMYAEEIQELSKYRMDLDYAIGWDELNEFEGKETIGQCTILNGKPARIIIDQETWNNSSEAERLALMAHELVHCEFLYGHIKKSVDPEKQLMATQINYGVDCIMEYGVTECINQTVELYKKGLVLDSGESEVEQQDCDHDH